MRTRKLILGLTVFLLLVYLIASFLPESPLWGVNHLSALSLQSRLAIFAVAFGVIVLGTSRRFIDRIVADDNKAEPGSSSRRIFLPIMCALLGGGVFYWFRIATDMYGDTRSLVSFLMVKEYSISDLFNIRDIEPLTRLFHQTIANLLQIDISTAFQSISIIAGCIYILLILFFLRSLYMQRMVRILSAIILLAIGSNQLFFGHVEDYTLLYLTYSLLLILGWKYFDGAATLPWMIVIFLVGLRLHGAMVLFLPPLLYVVCYKYLRNKPRSSQRRFVLYGLASSGILALVLYIFNFQAYEIKSIDQEYITRKIFLPIFTPITSLNDYTLQSWEHLNDVLQLIFLMTTPGILIVYFYALVVRSRIKWNVHRTMFLSITSVYFLLFVATVNPILSMPRDWDLFATVALPLAFLAVSLIYDIHKDTKEHVPWSILLAASLAGALLSSSFFVINHDAEIAGGRLRSVGMWVFKSYHRGSSYIINVGCKSITDIDEQIKERQRILEKLAASKNQNDTEYAFLQMKLGEQYYLKKDLRSALHHYYQAYNEDATNGEALKGYAVLNIKTWRFEEGIRLLDYYNLVINDPNVQDPKSLIASAIANKVRFMKGNGADSVTIESTLNSLVLIRERD